MLDIIDNILKEELGLHGIYWGESKYNENYFYIRKNKNELNIVYNKNNKVNNEKFNTFSNDLKDKLINFIKSNFNIDSVDIKVIDYTNRS